MKKEPPKGPVIRRDENNMLDQNHADEVVTHLTKELINTERDFQKDNMLKHVSSTRRDIIVKTILMQRNTFNGHLVKEDYQNPRFEKLSDDPLDPYRYNTVDFIDGEIMAKEMPMSASHVGKWTMGMFKCVVNYLAKMNVMDRV